MYSLSIVAIIVAVFCLTATVSSCQYDSECSRFQVCDGGMCSQRSWRSFIWRDWIAFVAIFVGSLFAAGGGIGGGGVFIPIMTLIVGMTAKQAIPVSQATILGGSLANLTLNARARHPHDQTKPLIDYSILMIFTPMLMTGTMIGVMLNVIFPAWLVTSLLFIILTGVAWRSVKKTMMSWRKEGVAQATAAAELSNSTSEFQPTFRSSLSLSYSHRDHDESEVLSRYDVLAVVLIWSISVVFAILKGSKPGGSSVAGVESCSPMYWMLDILFIMIMSALTVLMGRHLQSRTRNRQQVMLHDSRPTDLYLGSLQDSRKRSCRTQWDRRSTIVYPMMSAVAGLVGGLLGIGGGMVLAPLLLELNFHSCVVAATSATAVLLTSSSALLQYLLLDMLIPSYSILLFCLGLIATTVGQLVFDYLIRTHNRLSFIPLSISIMIITSTIMLGISGVMDTISDYHLGRLGFHSMC